MIGESLGPYKILEPLGKGGMGEVYLGEDTRLDRTVAIKVLPAEFASDPERLARFAQEARAAAALNHPHIAVVHDVGSETGENGATIHYIVQEHLEGETLREPLKKGSLASRKILTLALEVTEAIGAAHAAGIVHRDLKPDNIFVTKDGHAKVLDFGLAKLTEIAGPAGTEISMSPTVLGTVAGQVMGTAGYMSPEQVEGDGEIDGRADIFAFGCVLYEMAVGKRAFGGESVLDTLHAIARTDPQPVGDIKPDTPAELGRILDKCLAKERERRYQHAEDLLVDLRRLTGDVEAGTAPSFADGAVPAAAPPARRAMPLVAAGLVVGAVLATIAGIALRFDTTSGNEVTRFEFAVSEERLDLSSGSQGVVLSPDGQTIAYTTYDGLWVRRLDGFEARRIVDSTEGFEGWIDSLAFSPDGQWLAYRERDTVFRVPVSGGSPLAVAEIGAGGRGTAWDEADAIMVSDRQGPVLRVPIDGSGEPEPVTELQGDEITHRFAQLLPGGEALLFTAHTLVNLSEGANIMVRDLTTGEQRVVFQGGSFGRYVPSGHLVYSNGGAVFAAPFDIDELRLTGPSAPVLEDVYTWGSDGAASYHFSENGTLVYVPYEGEVGGLNWAITDPEGDVEQVWVPDAFSYGPALSPDSSRLVASVSRGDGGADLWSWDLARAAPTRITFSETTDVTPVWMPEQRELIYAARADETETFRLYRMRADGSGEGQPLEDPDEVSEFASAVSADGRWLLTNKDQPDGRRALQVRDLTGGDAPRVALEIEDTIAHADLSPDAHWIAYSSNESGDWEIYAIPFLAEGGEKVTVSVSGGGMPHWSDDGRSIYYRSQIGVMVVDLELVDGRLRPSAPEPVFEGAFFGGPVGFPFGGAGLANFDVSHDGQAFVLQQATGGNTQTNAIIVFNWFEELKRLVPTGR